MPTEITYLIIEALQLNSAQQSRHTDQTAEIILLSLLAVLVAARFSLRINYLRWVGAMR